MIELNRIYGIENLEKKAIAIKRECHEEIKPAPNGTEVHEKNICWWGPKTAEALTAVANHFTSNYLNTYNQNFEFLEIIVTCPFSAVCPYDFFSPIFNWFVERFGDWNVLSFDVHCDEEKNNCHVILVPKQDIYLESWAMATVGSEDLSTEKLLQHLRLDLQELMMVECDLTSSSPESGADNAASTITL